MNNPYKTDRHVQSSLAGVPDRASRTRGTQRDRTRVGKPNPGNVSSSRPGRRTAVLSHSRVLVCVVLQEGEPSVGVPDFSRLPDFSAP